SGEHHCFVEEARGLGFGVRYGKKRVNDPASKSRQLLCGTRQKIEGEAHFVSAFGSWELCLNVRIGVPGRLIEFLDARFGLNLEKRHPEEQAQHDPKETRK